MNNFHRLKSQFTELYSLTRLQRGLRLLLRAFWLGLTGILAGWGLNALTGWLPNPAVWILIGFAFALVPVALALVSLYPTLFTIAPHTQWIWNIDRKFGLRQQLSTAWELAEKDRRGPVSDLLVQDMLAQIPRMRKEILKDGWYRKADLVSSIITLLFVCILFTSMLFQPRPNPQTQNPPETAPQTNQPQLGAEQSEQGQQPGQGEQPQSGEAPGGEAGEGSGAQPGEGSAGNSSSSGGDQASGSSAGSPTQNMDAQAMADALRKMGSELSQQAGTYELGKALENLDMENSAQALENMNTDLKEISPETREKMAQAMQEAAEAIDAAGNSEMSENMNQAAESLPEANQDANQALGDVADNLRQMGSAMQSAVGANNGAGQGQGNETGEPEPVERLAGEGGDFNLPQENAANSDLLSPAPPDSPAQGTASGSLDSTSRAGDNVSENPILPNSLLWKWRNVVSEYFQR